MLQKVNRLLTILMLSLIGVFLGYSIYTCADYRTRPGLYELYSAGARGERQPRFSFPVICMPNVSVP